LGGLTLLKLDLPRALSGPIALAVLLLGGIDAARAETPQSVTIALTTRNDIPFPNVVSIGVGGGQTVPVTFDVGSSGLYILESAIGPDVVPSTTPFSYTYADKMELTGVLGLAKVAFVTSEGVIETRDLEFGIIQSYTCGDEANCMTGRVGIMGTRYYNDDDNNVFSPLAFLPDNLSSGYLVAATGPTPSIILGLTENNIRGLPYADLDSRSTVNQGDVPYAWEIKSVHTCYVVNGGSPSCDAHTSFDTGASSAAFTYSTLPDGVIAPGRTVTVTVTHLNTGTTLSTGPLTTGTNEWVNLYHVIATPEGSPPGFNSGAFFYNSFAVAYDYFQGRAYFTPITTWITGTYQPASDADLGPPGSIALAGTLVLPQGFSTTRPIFIGNDSTIASLGASTLAGTLSGGALLTLTGPGALTLTGHSVNTGPMLVTGGTLFVDGSTSAPVLLNNGMLGGNGSVGALAALTGGFVAPGHSIGTLNVTGDVLFSSGSTYAAEIGVSGKSDRINAGGKATIAGGTLLVVADATYQPGFDRYMVLTAKTGIVGAFDLSAPNFGTTGAAFPFLGVTATTTANSVIVDVGRSDVSFAAAALTRNQRAAAFGADQLDLSSGLLEALAGLNFVTAPAALDAISGEIYASAQTVMIEDAAYTRNAILGRLRQVGDASVIGAAADDAPSIAAPASVWAQGYGGFGENDASRNLAEVGRSGGGF